MNIVVKTASGNCIVRPDTTWERDSEDLYLPEFVKDVTYAPVLFARISKPGRSVGEEFAGRYFDGIGFGVLLYPEDMIDGTPEGFACASCLDHTSFLPFPVYNPITLGHEGNVFKLFKDGEEIFSYEGGSLTMIGRAIAQATRRIYIRTGDLIAIELQERRPLMKALDGKAVVSATWCDNESMKFNIIM